MDYEYILEKSPNIFGLAMLASAFSKHEQDGRISSVELSRGHDYHTFYRLGRGNENKVVHVQFYPGMSTIENAWVFARLMNYNKMMQIREAKGVSKGNEHDAVIMPFPNFMLGTKIKSYDPKILEEMIEKNVPELRGRK